MNTQALCRSVRLLLALLTHHQEHHLLLDWADPGPLKPWTGAVEGGYCTMINSLATQPITQTHQVMKRVCKCLRCLMLFLCLRVCLSVYTLKEDSHNEKKKKTEMENCGTFSVYKSNTGSYGVTTQRTTRRSKCVCAHSLPGKRTSSDSIMSE